MRAGPGPACLAQLDTPPISSPDQHAGRTVVSQGQTPLDIARDMGSWEVVDYLEWLTEAADAVGAQLGGGPRALGNAQRVGRCGAPCGKDLLQSARRETGDPPRHTSWASQSACNSLTSCAPAFPQLAGPHQEPGEPLGPARLRHAAPHH